MAKREGFIPIYHEGIDGTAEVHESTFPALAARGWKKGTAKSKTTTSAAPAADEKKG